MIAPSPHPAAPAASVITDATDVFFKPGGLLEKACAREPFPYEPRPQQRDMAVAVSQTIESARHLIVEAGTGVGKSFAYLVPAILAAVQNKVQVVVSTHTISLQEQLMYKDIPFLQEHLGVEFKAALVKGRDNYLCRPRLDRALRMGKDLFDSDRERELEKISAWAEATTDGSLQDMLEQPPYEVWSVVNAEEGICTLGKHDTHRDCFLWQARKAIREAQVLVVNHHLLFSDLALRAEGSAFLPPYSVVILDEAHLIENVASEHFGLRLSHYAFEHWLRRLYVPEKEKGLLAVLKQGRAAHAVTKLRDAVEPFFRRLGQATGFDEQAQQQVLTEPIEMETELPHLIGRLTALLEDLAAEVRDPELQAELDLARRRGVEMRTSLEAFLHQACEDHVYWLEKEGRSRQTVMHSAPIEVGPILQAALFHPVDTVVMTSATLAVDNRLDFYQERVGARNADTVGIGSPFDFNRQMKVYVPSDMPAPTDEEKFPPACASAIEHFVERTGGRAFVLFTNARLMKRIAGMLSDGLADRGFKLYVQGAGLPRHVMLEKFRNGSSAVLFGLDSFWMGVDVRGEALSNVIITRLPFAVPDHPIIKARMDRIRETGGEPFRDYALPEAILKFRQGVGRLIRTATDEGIVVVLDNRILHKWYGKLFLESIPECPVEVVDL